MFNSETYGKMELKEIPEKLLEFYDKVKQYDTSIQLIVGTDSQTFATETKIVNVITMICEGHGGIYFYEVSKVPKMSDVRTKLYAETAMSLRTADSLLALLEDDDTYSDLYSNIMFTIHVDAGNSENGKTKELIPAITGWIKGQGYEYEIKPDSFVASTIADRISK